MGGASATLRRSKSGVKKSKNPHPLKPLRCATAPGGVKGCSTCLRESGFLARDGFDDHAPGLLPHVHAIIQTEFCGPEDSGWNF